MTNNLFLFCIGGTGARVLKALTFLLASGMKIKANKVIPILIDPDRDNGDVTRTIEILNKYQDIRKHLEFDKNKFFKTEIQTLSSLQTQTDETVDKEKPTGFKFAVDGTQEGKFRDFIGYDYLQGANKALISALFSDKNLNADLEVGFKGNPHMGSIVLNKLSDSDEFAFFASRFGPEDRIFIVSSIFGGTGAAGFPLLVKNLRNPKGKISNKDRIKDAKIGAVTVKPYFGVAPSAGSDIDKGTFITKTKAALRYYARHISGNSSLNALYYIGDKRNTDYENNEGSKDQKNHAHIVELLSALAVADFLDVPDDKLQCSNGKAVNPIYRRYGINKVNIGQGGELRFINLGSKSKVRIYQTLIQYNYAVQFWNNNLNAIPRDPWATNGQITYENGFLSEDFFNKHLKKFNQRFVEWLVEMKDNTRSFSPLETNVPEKLLHTMVVGVQQKKKGAIWNRKSEWDYFDYTKYLNEAALEVGELDRVKKFMATFFVATHKIYEDRIKA